jgi:dihydroorotate dehydrogenase (NAD+) catalytic subunit
MMTTTLGPLVLQNPIMTASGTYGYGTEFSDFVALDRLGAITLKSVTLEPKAGNPPPRVLETPSGLLNSIGLENKGIDHLVSHLLPCLNKLKKVKVIGNIAGHSYTENIELARILNDQVRIDALELNISCPNVSQGGLAFCHDLESVKKLVSGVKKVYSGPLIVKLSVAVPDFIQLAEVSIDAGADILSMINTVPGLEVDIKERRLHFKRGSAGLSGPCIRPIALKAVYDIRSKFSVPIIGMGGVATVDDVIKFLIVGASAVATGMMNFVNPTLTVQLIEQLESYLKSESCSLSDLTLK